MILSILTLIISLLIYGSFGITGFIYLVSAVIISFFAGILTEKYKWVLYISLILNAGILIYIKLLPLTGLSFISVMGISYFTLEIISYNVDIYKGKYAAERNFFKYASYICFCPHLFIGPIERYDYMEKALFKERKIEFNNVLTGVLRALWGGFKKIILASRAGVLISFINSDPESYGGAYALFAMFIYSLQLYADFSGGIDMVIGISKIFGVKLHENFSTPYFSETFQEFWRRWHITLGAWLKDYIYIPLGGNRKGKVRKTINLIITFLVSGLWHGVEYILWGLFNGILVATGNKLKTPFKHLNRVITFILVSFLWSFFIWPDAITSVKMLGSVFYNFNYSSLFGSILDMGLSLSDYIILTAGSATLFVYDANCSKINSKIKNAEAYVKVLLICVLALLILLFGMYGIGFNAEAFIYSRY